MIVRHGGVDAILSVDGTGVGVVTAGLMTVIQQQAQQNAPARSEIQRFCLAAKATQRPAAQAPDYPVDKQHPAQRTVIGINKKLAVVGLVQPVRRRGLQRMALAAFVVVHGHITQHGCAETMLHACAANPAGGQGCGWRGDGAIHGERQGRMRRAGAIQKPAARPDRQQTDRRRDGPTNRQPARQSAGWPPAPVRPAKPV